jgi:hypothetical protein
MTQTKYEKAFSITGKHDERTVELEFIKNSSKEDL